MDLTALMTNPRVKDMLMTAGLSMLANNQNRVGQPAQSFGSSLGQGMLTGMQYADQNENQRKKEYWNNYDRGVEQANTLSTLDLKNKQLEAENQRNASLDAFTRAKYNDTKEQNDWERDYRERDLAQRGAANSALMDYREATLAQREEAAKQKKPGFTVRTNPDGSTEIIQGEGGGVTKPTQTKAEQGLIEARTNLGKVDTILKGFNRDLLTYQGQAKQWARGQYEKLGGTLSPEQAAKQKEFARFSSVVTRSFNDAIHSLSGAVVNKEEIKRMEQAIANMGDNPTDFITKAEVLRDELNNLIETNSRVLTKGVEAQGTPKSAAEYSDDDLRRELGF